MLAGSLKRALLFVLVSVLLPQIATAQAIDGGSTISSIERPMVLYTLALPDGSCHPNPVFPQTNCIEDHFHVGTPDFPDGFVILQGIFDTGSQFVVIDDYENTNPFSTTVAIGFCNPPLGENCGAPFAPNSSLPRSIDANIPAAVDVSLWSFNTLSAAGGITEPQFEAPVAVVPGQRVVVASGLLIPRIALLGAPVANRVVAHMDFTTTEFRTPRFLSQIPSAPTRLYAPGDPAIPAPLFEADLVPIGDAEPSDIDGATPDRRFLLDRFTFTNGNRNVSAGDAIDTPVANTVQALFDTGNERTQVTRAMADLLEMPPAGAICLPPDCVPIEIDGQDRSCHRVDTFEIAGNAGGYKYQIDDPFVCVREDETAWGGPSDVIIGMNYFRNTQILFDGPGRELGLYQGLETFLFSTIETNVSFDIEHGRVNAITITEGNPGYPDGLESPIVVVLGNIVFFWNVFMESSSEHVAQNVRLWLFERRPGSGDPGTLPSYQGRSPGEFLLRYPSGDNSFPRKEDTDLWDDYIDPFWRVVPGAHEVIDDFTTERENEEWPQRRAVAVWDHPSPNGDPELWLVDGVPLRVSIAGLPDQKDLLLLFELKRFGRLYLVARPLRVAPQINSETEIDTNNCALSVMVPEHMEPQLDELREFRDEVLMASAPGRALVDAYYALSPTFVAMAGESEGMRQLMTRFVEEAAEWLGEDEMLLMAMR